MSGWLERAHFLFRDEYGTIDARTWRTHTGWMLVLLAALTAIWIALRPYAHHDLATSPLIVPMTIVAYFYLISYSFAILFVSISFVMLSMKRLRDRGEPTGLAGLVPLLSLFAGAAHWLQPQTPDVISIWYVVAIDAALLAASVWTIVDLGFRNGRRFPVSLDR